MNDKRIDQPHPLTPSPKLERGNRGVRDTGLLREATWFKTRLFTLCALAALLLAACVEEPPSPTPTATNPPPDASATPDATATSISVVAPAELLTYRHKTGVFSI